MKKLYMILILLCFQIGCVNVSAAFEIAGTENIAKAKVTAVYNTTENETDFQTIEAEILQGEHAGKVISFNRSITKYSNTDYKLYKGADIYVRVHKDEQNRLIGNLYTVSRERSIYILTGIFFAILLLFGMKKGLTSAISLIFTGIMVIKFFIPWVIQGKDPIISAVIICSIIIMFSFILISGFTKKTLAAILGTVTATIIAGLFALYFSNTTFITGVIDDDMQMLITEIGLEINVKGLLFSGILFGTMGAVMDVAMSIASIIQEIKEHHAKASWGVLVSSGMKVGKDIIATMVDTLILAYAGAALPTFIFFSVMNTTVERILNSELIATEIIRSLCGSIGIMFAVPLTSIFAAIIISKKTNRFLRKV